jgi:acyl-CoA reductase-like NAD-dependent aldehyde dehydrogenase
MHGWADTMGVDRAEFLAVLDDIIAKGENYRLIFERLRPGFDVRAAAAERKRSGTDFRIEARDLYADARPCLSELTQDGWFVRPTLFTDVTNQMAIAREEIFGPVLCVIPYQDEAEAVATANDTEYGLSAMVLGRDVERARRVAQQIVAGRVLVNTLAHEPKAPFGGFRHSGVGREMGEWGIRAFMEPKSILG